MLKRILASLDEVDEQYRALYKQGADGKWHLQAEPDTDTDALKNALAMERDAAKAAKAELLKFKDVDPSKYAEALKKLQEIDDKKLLDEGKVEELLNQRTERMRTEYTEQTNTMKKSLEEKDTKIAQLVHRLGEEMNEKAIMGAVPKVGQVRAGAMTDILNRARATWRLNEDGTHMAYGHDGKPLYGNDGKSPLSHEEWLQALAKDAPFFFEGSKGAGGGLPPEPAGGAKSLTEDQQNLPPVARLGLAWVNPTTPK